MASSTTSAKGLILFALVAVVVKLAQSQSCPLPGFFTSDTEFGTGVKEPGQDIATDEMFVCLTDLKARNVKTLTMDCVPKDGSLNVKWFRNGVDITASLEDPNSYTFNVENGVNITCEIMNECGTNTYPAIFSDSRATIEHFVILDNSRLFGVTAICLDFSNPSRESAVFSCPVTNQDQSVGFERNWYRDMIEIAGASTLESITVRDLGTYRCTAENACKLDDAEITVNANPVIRKGNGTITGNVADIGANLCTTAAEAMLNCHILNNVVATRTWRKNGVILPETGETLTITPPVDTNDMYTCTVQNMCAMDSASTTVFKRLTADVTASIAGLTSNGCNRASTMDVSGANLCPNIGETVTISCTASDSYTIYGPDGATLATNQAYTIPSYMVSNDGTYSCNTSSVCNTASDTITITHLGIPPTIPTATQGNPCEIPPCNGSAGTDICVAPGLTANLVCVANGTVTSYTWSKNGVFFSNEQNLTNVEPGTYTCTATNAAGSDSQTSRVIEINTVVLNATRDSVNRCSQLRSPPPAGTDFCAFVRDRVTLRCTPSQPGVQTEINPGGDIGQKIFNSIQLQDAGSYLCNATTVCGSNTSMINIRVYDPARIDRGKTLPAPGENELVQGAGRTSEEVCGRDNNKISLHCCYSGFTQPVTMWLFIAEGSTEAVPINDTTDPNIMITDDGMNSVLMIQPFGEAYAGTYRCNTTNIAGTDAGDVNVIYKPPEEKEWLVSAWSRCFPDCHRGVRNRTVVCVTVSNRMPMDGCTPPPPPSEEQCTERGHCTHWVPGNWSVCTKTCGIGYQVRRVSCRATYDNSLELDDSECLTARPPVFRYCNIHDCPCVEPRFCDFLVGTEMCWRADIQRDCCCTCGPAP